MKAILGAMSEDTAVGDTKFDMVFDEMDNEGGSPNQRGFSASMSGLNLFDFVQMECLAGARRAIRVTSGNNIGYLFFSDGTVTHALTPDASGEVAALQILRWREGNLEQCALHPDEQARIRNPWQQLLLYAAQQQDESSRNNLVEFPRQKSSSAPLAEEVEFAPESHLSTLTRDSVLPMASKDGVIGAVRLDPSGEIVAVRGQSEELPGLAGYALRLVELIGNSLGLEQVKTIDARLARTRYAIKKGGNGSVVVVRALTSGAPTHDSPSSESSGAGHGGSLSEAETKELLSGLKDIEGVFGSFLIDMSGAIVGLDLPKLFGAPIVGEVGKRLVRLRENFETQGDELRSLEVRYAQQRVYLRVCDSFLLGVVILGNVNMALLSMATSVVVRSRRALAPSSRGVSPPSLRLPAPEPGTPASAAAPKRTLAPSGAPGAPAAPRSNRPIFFRGRRVT